MYSLKKIIEWLTWTIIITETSIILSWVGGIGPYQPKLKQRQPAGLEEYLSYKKAKNHTNRCLQWAVWR